MGDLFFHEYRCNGCVRVCRGSICTARDLGNFIQERIHVPSPRTDPEPKGDVHIFVKEMDIKRDDIIRRFCDGLGHIPLAPNALMVLHGDALVHRLMEQIVYHQGFLPQKVMRNLTCANMQVLGLQLNGQPENDAAIANTVFAHRNVLMELRLNGAPKVGRPEGVPEVFGSLGHLGGLRVFFFLFFSFPKISQLLDPLFISKSHPTRESLFLRVGGCIL